MIFVTVGTHEQPFNRLVEYVDKLRKNGSIDEEVIIQTGYCTYEPQYCKWSSIIPYEEMAQNIKNARIVISHGGPASFLMALQMGKVPVVVPRMYKYGEHVNDHQVEFAKEVSQRLGNIIPVYDIEDLDYVLNEYNNIVKNMKHGAHSNNIKFNIALEDKIDKLLELV